MQQSNDRATHGHSRRAQKATTQCLGLVWPLAGQETDQSSWRVLVAPVVSSAWLCSPAAVVYHGISACLSTVRQSWRYSKSGTCAGLSGPIRMLKRGVVHVPFECEIGAARSRWSGSHWEAACAGHGGGGRRVVFAENRRLRGWHNFARGQRKLQDVPRLALVDRARWAASSA